MPKSSEEALRAWRDERTKELAPTSLDEAASTVTMASESESSSGTQLNFGAAASHAHALDAALREIVVSALAAGGRMRARDEDVRKRLETRLQTMHSGLCIKSFGSSVTGLHVSDASDVDVCLTHPDWEDSKLADGFVRDTLRAIATFLRKCHNKEYTRIDAVLTAKVPLLKCFDIRAGVSCDLMPNNLRALHNSRLLRCYAEQSREVRELMLVVKSWASRNGLNDARHHGLSSYGHVVSVIHYCLAVCQPPLLVDLLSGSLCKGQSPCVCEGIDVTFFEDVEAAQAALLAAREAVRVPEVRDPCLTELLIGYFEYMHDAAGKQMCLTVRARGEDTLEAVRRYACSARALALNPRLAATPATAARSTCAPPSLHAPEGARLPPPAQLHLPQVQVARRLPQVSHLAGGPLRDAQLAAATRPWGGRLGLEDGRAVRGVGGRGARALGGLGITRARRAHRRPVAQRWMEVGALASALASALAPLAALVLLRAPCLRVLGQHTADGARPFARWPLATLAAPLAAPPAAPPAAPLAAPLAASFPS